MQMTTQVLFQDSPHIYNFFFLEIIKFEWKMKQATTKHNNSKFIYEMKIEGTNKEKKIQLYETCDK